jgi:hypothetical protein
LGSVSLLHELVLVLKAPSGQAMQESSVRQSLPTNKESKVSPQNFRPTLNYPVFFIKITFPATPK